MNLCEPIPKGGKKKKSRKSIHDFSPKVKKKEYEDAKGICRICHSRPITQYHHANEKGMGGGRGLGIQINCIGVCDTCHDHNNTEFLKKSNEILKGRMNKLFTDETGLYGAYDIIWALNIEADLFFKQAQKGFIKATYIVPSVYQIEDIERWLGVA